MKLSPLTSLPDLLSVELEKTKALFVERNLEYAEWFQGAMKFSVFSDQLSRVWISSDYAADICRQQPEMFKHFVDTQQYDASYDKTAFLEKLKEQIADVSTVERFDVILRQFRAAQMLRIIWRDLNRLADFNETTRDISLLAEACIELALDFHHSQQSQIYGKPCALVDDQYVEQKMLVIGMGKLGAMELNLSSDIDLIFTYPHSGETRGSDATKKTKCLDNGEFFTRVARKLIQSLDQITADGFVFRVDMRLRPYGESGALVMSFSAMEEYYQSQGRDWERYAMIKARVVAGDPQAAMQLMTTLRPFTYRRYIDFSAVESLRAMKQMIQQEVKRRGVANDVKLGPGGIREIEFIAQCFQLIRGGRDLDLQERSVQKVLSLLAYKDYLPHESVNKLQLAYVFLRNTEHVLQAYKDQQTQALPNERDRQSIVAFAMGFNDWPAFSDELDAHRKNVSDVFAEVISEQASEENTSTVDQQWIDLWKGVTDESVQRQILEEAGYDSCDQVLQRLKQLREHGDAQCTQVAGQDRLDQFMPLLLKAVNACDQAGSTLLRILPLVEGVLRRTTYLVLLIENPAGLQQLVTLCAGSPWIAAQLTRHPVLLDELLDERTLYQVPDKISLRDELKQQMLRVTWNDLEGHMEGLRYFKQAHQLQVSAAEVTGRLPLTKISDYLSMIAEVILEHVLDVAWNNLTERHGLPQKADGIACEKNFIIIGYGKLGGLELSHSSDLDLVFLHDAASHLTTDGNRPVENGVFFARLGQRIIHILTALTPSGMLYEVDMRLRPSGNSGLLVTPLNAFKHYQANEAWTWEHQALVRARVVAGSVDLAESFAKLRRDTLSQSRDVEVLKRDVVTMREKMRDHLLPKGLERANPPLFHLKHSRGAIVDIEFMVQYAVIAWSHKYPALTVYTDNIRILETLGNQGLFEPAETKILIEAYKAYRAASHRLSLLEQATEVPLADFEQYIQPVTAKWTQLFG